MELKVENRDFTYQRIRASCMAFVPETCLHSKHLQRMVEGWCRSENELEFLHHTSGYMHSMETISSSCHLQTKWNKIKSCSQ